jgi:hypothetical protein
VKEALGKLTNGYPLIPFTVGRKKRSGTGGVNTQLAQLYYMNFKSLARLAGASFRTRSRLSAFEGETSPY